MNPLRARCIVDVSTCVDVGTARSTCNSLHDIASFAQALRAEADGRPLVLLDEVGTGTEPVEGAALGIALLRALAGSGPGTAALTIGTTHHRCCCCLGFRRRCWARATTIE